MLPGQMTVGLQSPRRNQHHGVAIHQPSLGRNQHRAVRIAVERHPCIGAGFQNRLAQPFDMQRAAIEVDISAVRLIADRRDLRAGFTETARRQPGRRPVAAIDHDPQPIEPRSDGGQQEIQIGPDIASLRQGCRNVCGGR